MVRFLLCRAVRDRLQWPAKELSVKTRVLLVALGLAAFTLFGTSIDESAAPVAFEEAAQVLPAATSAEPERRLIATLPTVAPIRETVVSLETAPPLAGFTAASLPALDRHSSFASLPTLTPPLEPEPVRTGCDPAYPDARTCIPSGPPFDQGCAITDQRLFTVLAPDPQGLDHDDDGIGCEPISG